MNPRIFVGIAVTAFAIILGIVASSGQPIFNDVSEGGLLQFPETTREIIPLEVELEHISILEVSNRAATIEVEFKVSNPNYKSVILQFLKYELYENDKRIHVGVIGEQPTGFVASSNYFTILTERPTILSDTISIKNTGNTPELWNAFMDNSPNWGIYGEGYFNLSSMTSGAENIVTFKFLSVPTP